MTNTGGVVCWGDNSAGQLGDGTTSSSRTPVEVSSLSSGAAAVSAGSQHTCTLTTAGGVKCWGGNNNGQLGNGADSPSRTPVAVSGLSSGVAAISAGDDHTCVLTNAGGVKCWGRNIDGALGNGSTEPAHAPVDVSGLTSGVTAIAAGGFHTCALTTAGVKCWGGNREGQLGNGTQWEPALTPVAVTGMGPGVAAAIAAGGDHSCALTSAGGVKCWGSNGSGELGNGDTTRRLVPTAVSGLVAGVAAIDLGHWHTCALISGGAKCWGNNAVGQLGDGTNSQRLTPVAVNGLTTGVAAIAGGAFHTCALNTSGGAQCWGNGNALGDGSALPRHLTPVAVSGLNSDVTAMAAGDNHTCALTAAGSVKCWGSNLSRGGLLGGSSPNLTPVEVSGFGSAVSAIAAGSAHTCARTSGGGAMCWGSNDRGQLGDGGYDTTTTPVTVSGLGSGVAAIAAGYRHTCAVTTATGALCWGSNESGQLGVSTPDYESPTPVVVSGLASGVAAIAAGEGHTCALTTTGGVKCWGSGNAEPATIGDLTSGVTAIAAGGNGSTCALTTAGAVKCWTSDNPVPTVVGDLTSGVAAIVMGYMHSCALTTAGGMKCWGYNHAGQLGDGTTNQRASPVAVNGLDSGVTAMAAGYRHTCAVVGAGEAKCWGDNRWGQLGNGEAGFSNTPRTVRSGTLVFALTSSFNPSYFGQDIALTARLASAGAAGAPTGTVDFKDGASLLAGCTSVALSNGRAHCTAGALDVGSHTMTAVYSGDPNYEGGTSAVLTQTVSRAATTTTITGHSADPASIGTPVSVSVYVDVTPPGAGAPTGTILVTAGSANCTITLPGGTSCTLTPTGAGTEMLAASYEGDATFEGSLSPAPAVAPPEAPLSGIARIAAGAAHACVLTGAGGVRCWGDNASGQLGDGSTSASARPVPVTGLRSGVSAIAAGYAHACAVASGSVKCWGNNSQGQLGNGTTNPSLTPVPVSSPGIEYAAVAAGDGHTCALTTTGGVLCWGGNSNGQLGNGSTNPSLTPVAVSGLGSGVAAIAAGGAHSCALTTTGGVLCWGNNTKGQLGDGSSSLRLTPVAVADLSSGVSVIAAGSAHTCAVTTLGGAQCWGDNAYGQLGDGTVNPSLDPVAVSGLNSGAVGIAAGLTHSCAVTGSGGLLCWGRNDMGQLGVPGPAGSTNPSLVPVVVSGLSSDAAAVATGSNYSCALTTLGGVQCWGDNTSGQLGDGRLSSNLSPMPVAVGGLTARTAAIAAGGAHSCALGTTGGAQCWGRGGQLGDGTRTMRPRPTAVSGLNTGVAQIAAGLDHTCARTIDGGVQCWGYGALGNGTYGESLAPVAITGFGAGVAGISAGSAHTCAVTSTGGAWCWGEDFAGQLGNDANPGLYPGAVSGLGGGVASIAAGFDHTCALTTTGGVQCWGFGSTTTPLPVDGLSSGVAAIAAGGVQSLPCAVTESGTIRCWYQFGPPWDDAPWSASGIAAVAVGGSHTCALTTAGGVRCWGDNEFGQLGDGTISQHDDEWSGPVAVRGMSAGVVAIAAGDKHTCAIVATGHVYCWGYDADGQLGDEARASATPRTVVVSVGSSTTTALTSSAPWSYFGQSITLTATVSGPGTPGGKVAFKDGVSVIAGCGSVDLNAGQAQCMTSALGVGNHSITAVYQGDAENGGSTSAVLRQDVRWGRTTTSITAHTPDPVTLGSAIAVSAKVSAMDPGPASPTGTIFVAMWDGDAYDVCEIALPATSCDVTPTIVGTTYLRAVYSGDNNFDSSESDEVIHTVTLASSTTTAVEPSANPSYLGQNVTFTATVTGTNPVGWVEFRDGTDTITGCDARQVTDAKATCTTNALTLGWHAITAVYSGDPANLGSTSPALDLEIIPADPPPTVMSLELADPSPTMADAVRYTLKFSEPVSGLAALNFTITPTGITSPSIGSISGSGDTWTITVNTGRHTGRLRLGLTDATGIKDSAGNAPANLPFFGEPYEIDKGGTVLGTGQGQPDSTFGTNGYALFNLQQGVASPGAVAVLASGRILAAGGIGCDPATGSNCTLQLAQYLGNGMPDGGFGSSGRIPTTIAGIDPDLGALIVNGDGTFFVAGSRATGGAKVPFVAKFASNGNAAGSYGTGGVALLSSLPLGSAITGAAVDDAGRVLVAGTKASAAPQGMDLFVARLTTAGKLDGGFGSGGVASFGVSVSGARDDLGTDIAVQPNGRIVVGGRTLGADGFDFLLLRLNANGAPDKPFGNAGIVTSRFDGSTGDNLGRKLALQADGRIVLAGAVATSGGNQCGIARFNADGTPDASFGTNGRALIPLTQGCLAVTVQEDGKLLVAAQDRDVDVYYATLARVLANGATDTAFGNDGVLDISSYGPATKVALTAEGDLVSGLVIEDPTDGIRKSYVVQLGAQLAQATTTKITSIAPSPALTGQAYAVAVTVTAGSGPPTGAVTVAVTDGEGASCTITLVAGSGACALTSTTKGGKTISATYAGSSDYRASVGTKGQQIDAAGTATTLAVSPNPSLAGAPVTLTAKVTATSPGATIPAGIVTFKDARTALGSAAVNGTGVATLTLALAAGTYDITANFDATDADDFRNSKSGVISLDVQPLPTLRFSAKDLTVSQKAGAATLTVQRVGSTLGTVTVAYASKDGTAKAPADYAVTTGSLSWAAGDATSRTISVPIVNRGKSPPDRKFTVSLSAPTGATLGSPATVTITIHN